MWSQLETGFIPLSPGYSGEQISLHSWSPLKQRGTAFCPLKPASHWPSSTPGRGRRFPLGGGRLFYTKPGCHWLRYAQEAIQGRPLGQGMWVAVCFSHFCRGGKPLTCSTNTMVGWWSTSTYLGIIFQIINSFECSLSDFLHFKWKSWTQRHGYARVLSAFRKWLPIVHYFT